MQFELIGLFLVILEFKNLFINILFMNKVAFVTVASFLTQRKI